MTSEPAPADVVLRLMPDGAVRIELHAEICDTCEQRVVYWNDDGVEGGSGNASCGCCTKGPEVCDPIALRPAAKRIIDAAARALAPAAEDSAAARRDTLSIHRGNDGKVRIAVYRHGVLTYWNGWGIANDDRSREQIRDDVEELLHDALTFAGLRSADLASLPASRSDWSLDEIAAHKRAGDRLVTVGDWAVSFDTTTTREGTRLWAVRLATGTLDVIERDASNGETFASTAEAERYALNAGRLQWYSDTELGRRTR